MQRPLGSQARPLSDLQLAQRSKQSHQVAVHIVGTARTTLQGSGLCWAASVTFVPAHAQLKQEVGEANALPECAACMTCPFLPLY